MIEAYQTKTIVDDHAVRNAQQQGMPPLLEAADQDSTLTALQDAYGLLLKAWSENAQLRSILGLNPGDAIPAKPASLSVN